MSSVIWNKYIMGSLLLVNTLFAVEIPLSEVEKRTFSEAIEINSQVVQLPSAKSTLMARLGGKVLSYHVKEGESVKKGQLIATIESLELTSELAELKGLKAQLRISDKNYKMTQKLYDIGVESLAKLNQQEESYTLIVSKIEQIESKLLLVKGRKGNSYKLYAQSSGKVDEFLIPLFSVVNKNEPLITLLKGEESFLIKSFIPLKYASKVRVGQEGSFSYGTQNYKMFITQILPSIDQKTQKIMVLSKPKKRVKNLFVNTFLDSELIFGEGKKYLTVKKSALSFFNNEWVVFVPEHHHEEKHETQKHNKSAHDEHEEEEIPYDIKVVKILKQSNKWVAIEGLNEHEEYVSDKSYYVKSLLLKSSLGGHGH